MIIYDFTFYLTLAVIVDRHYFISWILYCGRRNASVNGKKHPVLIEYSRVHFFRCCCWC